MVQEASPDGPTWPPIYTTVRDFQANVVDSGPGALRGYLANIEKVNVKGVELESNFVVTQNLSGHFAVTWMDAQYVSYEDGPCPMRKSGRPRPFAT